MGGVRALEVATDEDGQRLDRWFKRRFPGLGHGHLEKLLRTGQVRVDGARAKAGLRLKPGQRIRIPPLGEALSRPPPAPRPELSEGDARMLAAAVLIRDDSVIVLDKPPGLAVQGGSKTVRHLDAMLDALRFGASERPRLAHRLDKDTSGVLVLGRTARATARLAAAFKARAVRKTYWAAVVGVPRPPRGRLESRLAKGRAKGPGKDGERVGEAAEGKRAVTLYQVVDKAGRRAAFLALMPLTGRTHQLRAHCVALGTPILGDGKYGGAAAFVSGAGLDKRLHLHAREIVLPHPEGGVLRATAPLPPHMRATWELLGFDAQDDGQPFAGELSDFPPLR
ncbi:MAG: RluA family pseudouridine synthase [Alphaproteobacteria bacterium]